MKFVRRSFLWVILLILVLPIQIYADKKINDVEVSDVQQLDHLRTSAIDMGIVVKFDGDQSIIIGDMDGDLAIYEITDSDKIKLQKEIDYFSGVDLKPSGEGQFGLEHLPDENAIGPSAICPIPSKGKGGPKQFIVTNEAKKDSTRVYDYTGNVKYSTDKFSGYCGGWFNGVHSIVGFEEKLPILNLRSFKQQGTTNEPIDSWIRDTAYSMESPGYLFILTRSNKIYSVHPPSGKIELLADMGNSKANKDDRKTGDIQYLSDQQELIYRTMVPPHEFHRLDPETGEVLNSFKGLSEFQDFALSNDLLLITNGGAIAFISYPEFDGLLAQPAIQGADHSFIKWIDSNRFIVYGAFGARDEPEPEPDQIKLYHIKR